KTRTLSCFFAGPLLKVKKLGAIVFSHIHSLLNNFGLLITNALVNGWLAVSTIAPLSFITLSYCSHNGSKGIIVSHEHAVVPYGKSHKIISTDSSGIRFIPSKQSSLYILFISICSTLFSYLTFRISLFVYVDRDYSNVSLLRCSNIHLIRTRYIVC